MTTPEQRARKNIDQLLKAAGWQVQDRSDLNLGAGLGVAVREFQLSTGRLKPRLRPVLAVLNCRPDS
ncbi:MAG TPA: hypothetical protein PKM78_03390 [Anaerolineae bacterium]|nr:hypothetical protein [Anaerolineae bacterium]HNU02953.1 hypothetical protein [Anaerolineae bacterium]